MRLAWTLLFVASISSAPAFEFHRAADNTPIRWNAAQPIAWNVADGTPAYIRTALSACLKQWSDASGNALTFVEQPGGITLTCNPNSQLGKAMAYTNCQVQSGQIVHAAIELNAAQYQWDRVDGQYLVPALLHELGHALGLDHPHEDAADVAGTFLKEDPPTMWESLTLNAASLHVDDIIGLRTLYGLDTSSVALGLSVTEKHRSRSYTFTASDAPAAVYWNYGDGTGDTGGTHRYPRGSFNVQAESRGRSGSLTIQVGPPLRSTAQHAVRK